MPMKSPRTPGGRVVFAERVHDSVQIPAAPVPLSPPSPPTIAGLINRGKCAKCGRSVYTDEDRRQRAGLYYHAGCFESADQQPGTHTMGCVTPRGEGTQKAAQYQNIGPSHVTGTYGHGTHAMRCNLTPLAGLSGLQQAAPYKHAGSGIIEGTARLQHIQHAAHTNTPWAGPPSPQMPKITRWGFKVRVSSVSTILNCVDCEYVCARTCVCVCVCERECVSVCVCGVCMGVSWRQCVSG